MRWWLLAALVGLAVALGVRAGGRLGPGTTAASGCGPERPHASGTTIENITTIDGARSYRLHVPPSYTGFARVPQPKRGAALHTKGTR